MNTSLEFHDSEVGSVEAVGEDLLVRFSDAFVHESSGDPGIDIGATSLRSLELKFSEASWSGASLPIAGILSNGHVRLGECHYALLPLPFEAEGAVKAKFVFVSGEVLSVTARFVSCSL